ncbi:carbamoyltransferase HypF [Congregibacter variabilis]|uniref:acylphosphatase n=1 Tax=Congregibacter variabilis TaxID=3081200 RepID=A0ABZ0I256_9GAMM|nr:carbamoyltransferase HypF [Congregibacter sp. IMCC43200]
MPNPECRQLEVRGQVQGVGFRPFVFRLAQRLDLKGEVYNQSSGVAITVQGSTLSLDQFVKELRQEAPGVTQEISVQIGSVMQRHGFQIAPSRSNPGVASALLADQGICADCWREFHDPKDRRYRYAFIGCTRCGPRFSICERLPYDRANTSWKAFPLCEQCIKEHGDPADRRFHAVGLCCPQCGPRLFNPQGASAEGALAQACHTLVEGGIVAIKGSSGFHLMVDAGNAAAVQRLRQRKRRRKPLALLAPSMAWIKTHASVNAIEEAALRSCAAPIVLLESDSLEAELLAPKLGLLGVMLPYNGIQLALQERLKRPLVVTSANESGAPLIFENQQALSRLNEIADTFLLHDLSLVRGLDDPVQRCMADRAVTLRLGRGLAPQIHTLDAPGSSLGCGAHLKNSLALHDGHTLVAGPYIGDLDGAPTRQRYRAAKRELPEFFRMPIDEEITDLHPDYASTIDADYRSHAVPHHVAHAMAAWLEHRPAPPFTVLAWDGIGLGPDGSIWGGECLVFDAELHWHRLGSIRRFRLPPGEAISRYPGKIARALIGEQNIGATMDCSSMGRLIEGMAALAGLRDINRFEAQAAMEWEALAARACAATPMDLSLTDGDLDWRPLLELISDKSLDLGARARGFHMALARAAIRQCALGPDKRVLLSGGVFQNRLLVELLALEARSKGMTLYLPHKVPPNDGGVALGQCTARAMRVQPAERVA